MTSILPCNKHELPRGKVPPPEANGVTTGCRRSHVVASRTFYKYLDSSESFPSEHDSIYNAILLSYEDDGSKLFRDSEIAVQARTPPGIASAVKSDSKNSMVAQHGRKLQITRIETFSTSAALPLPPAVHTSKARHVSTIKELSGCRSSRFLKPISHNIRIYSFDDLDIPKSRPKLPATSLRRVNVPSASSSDSLESLSWLNEVSSPAEPRLPVFAPPVRSPTPPGVPSFGSLEAMTYDPSTRPRITSPRTHQHDNRSRLTDRFFRPSASGANNDNETSSCLVSMRQIFSITSSRSTRPKHLPPGAVARADDGTYIRARFGHRHSGHGVGAGPAAVGLESHPFHRRSLPTATLVNHAGNGERGQTASPHGRSRPVYKYPPYASMLDVPVPIKKPSTRPIQRRGVSPPEAASTTEGPGHFAHSSQGYFHPTLSGIQENTRSPPQPGPGYSAPVNMSFSLDGRGNDGENENAGSHNTSSSLSSQHDDGEEHSWCSCAGASNALAQLFKHIWSLGAARAKSKESGNYHAEGHGNSNNCAIENTAGTENNTSDNNMNYTNDANNANRQQQQ
ncbi:hypothetical protein VTO42DRAFT_5497 [Malbranchea cinnamomea]